MPLLNMIMKMMLIKLRTKLQIKKMELFIMGVKILKLSGLKLLISMMEQGNINFKKFNCFFE